MSSKKEDKAQVAAERIKAATLRAAKGLSRAQAERAAARNVNAYGQKEEGPSRWQERKEQKRQMYLMSTEKAVRLGERKNHSSMASNSSSSGASSHCQKCFQTGHWTYECKNERVCISRPSRTQQIRNPKLKSRLSVSYDFDNPNPDILSPKEEKRRVEKTSKSKRKHNDDSRSDSEALVFETDSGSSSDSSSSRGSSDSYSSSSDSEDEHRRRRKKSRKNYSSTSESASDSDSDDKRRRRNKSRRHHKRR